MTSHFVTAGALPGPGTPACISLIACRCVATPVPARVASTLVRSAASPALVLRGTGFVRPTKPVVLLEVELLADRDTLLRITRA